MCMPVICPHLPDFSPQQMQEVQPSKPGNKGRGKLDKQMALEAYQMPNPWPSKPGDRGKDWSKNNWCRSSKTKITKCNKTMNKDFQVCLLPFPFSVWYDNVAVVPQHCPPCRLTSLPLLGRILNVLTAKDYIGLMRIEVICDKPFLWDMLQPW